MRKAAAVMSCALISVGTAGCGGSSSGGSSSEGKSAEVHSATTTSGASTAKGGADTSSTGSAASSSGGIAKPGTTLSYGQSATVPYKDSLATYNAPATGQLRVTVTGVEKAAPGDFKNVELNASEKPDAMYYVRYSVTNTGTTDVNKGDGGGPDLEADDSSGEEASAVTIIGQFPACEWHEEPKPFTNGKTWTTCDIYDAPGG